jgi:hypothetical protein
MKGKCRIRNVGIIQESQNKAKYFINKKCVILCRVQNYITYFSSKMCHIKLFSGCFFKELIHKKKNVPTLSTHLLLSAVEFLHSKQEHIIDKKAKFCFTEK